MHGGQNKVGGLRPYVMELFVDKVNFILIAFFHFNWGLQVLRGCHQVSPVAHALPESILWMYQSQLMHLLKLNFICYKGMIIRHHKVYQSLHIVWGLVNSKYWPYYWGCTEFHYNSQESIKSYLAISWDFMRWRFITFDKDFLCLNSRLSCEESILFDEQQEISFSRHLFTVSDTVIGQVHKSLRRSWQNCGQEMSWYILNVIFASSKKSLFK